MHTGSGVPQVLCMRLLILILVGIPSITVTSISISITNTITVSLLQLLRRVVGMHTGCIPGTGMHTGRYLPSEHQAVGTYPGADAHNIIDMRIPESTSFLGTNVPGYRYAYLQLYSKTFVLCTGVPGYPDSCLHENVVKFVASVEPPKKLFHRSLVGTVSLARTCEVFGKKRPPALAITNATPG